MVLCCCTEMAQSLINFIIGGRRLGQPQNSLQFANIDYIIFKLMNHEDAPLGERFYSNPLEFMQDYVRNMNNEVFLSEFQINNLYALLLIGRSSPWDAIRSNSETLKEEIDVIVNKRVSEVKVILQTLSSVYQDRVKKTKLNQIQKLMSIIKSKKKSIYIEKAKKGLSHRQLEVLNLINRSHPSNNSAETNENHESQANQNQTSQIPQEPKSPLQIECKHQTQQQAIAQERDDKQVLRLFYGLTNLPNISELALGNFLEYNPAERFIKFKMSTHYNMTIKNDQKPNYDLESHISKIPSQLFTHHIFPYLGAVELFKVRAVCKQWMDNVKQSWHSTFKRQMFTQLLACQFCKDIEFYYKCVQLRNPFFQKLSLLIHALIEIIQWDVVYTGINNNTLNPQMKRVLIIILKVAGQNIQISNLNAITDEFFNSYKEKLLNLKALLSIFFSNLSGSKLNITQLREIKMNLLDDPFMRIEELPNQDKTPLLLMIFLKQMVLQQILRNNIFFAQQYLLNTKKRLDNVSGKMPQQKGFLEGVYKILLMKSMIPSQQKEEDISEVPMFNEMLQSIFCNNESNKPDFVIKSKTSSTQIYLDNATKLDIILSTVKSINKQAINLEKREEKMNQTQEKEDCICCGSQICQKQMKDEKIEESQRLKDVNSSISQTINIKIDPKTSEEKETNEKSQSNKFEKENSN